jgi:uridylate kinase
MPHLVRTIFREQASPRIITNPVDDPLPEESGCDIIVGAGWKPGWSTDYDAAMLAKRLGAKRVVNLSNTPFVYSEDPRQNPDAKKYETISWQELRTILGDEWKPGLNTPFDPIAAKLCDEHKLEVEILSADDMENVRKALTGEEFTGTRVR